MEKKVNLSDRWKEICNEYLRLFCKKHDLTYDPNDWVGGDDWVGTSVQPGGGDWFVSMDDIRYDIDHDVEPGKFSEYVEYDERLRDIEVRYGLMFDGDSARWERMIHINYRSFCKGTPLPYSSEDLDDMERKLRSFEDKKKEFDEFLDTASKK